MSNAEATSAKIREFRNLPVGWDYGNGGPASFMAVVGATGLITRLKKRGVVDFDAAPGRNGSVTLVAGVSGKELEVLCLTSGHFNLTLFDGENCEIFDDKSTIQLDAILRGFDWLENISTSCIQEGTYQLLIGTQVRHSKTQATGRGYRYYARNVSQRADGQSVIIYGNTLMSGLPETLPFSGESIQQICRTE